MNAYKDEIDVLLKARDEKEVEKLQINVFANLVEKVSDQEDPELDRQIKDIIRVLQENSELSRFYKKYYRKTLQGLKKYVRKEYGFLAKGTLLSEHMALGVGIGVVFGALLISYSVAFMGVGIALGTALGLATGQKKEKIEEENNNLY